MFKIKVCGITDVEDAQAAIDAGADAIGLNFYRGSKRHVHSADARRIAERIGHSANKIGVFVNESAAGIREVCREVGLHFVQLHGDEPPGFLKLLNADHDIIRARRLDDRGMQAIDDDRQACSDQAGV